MFESNGNWWWVDLSMLSNYNDGKRVIKKVMLKNCWCVMFENDFKAYCLFVDVVPQLHCCELCLVIKMVISSLFVRTCHLHCSETWLWQVLCVLRKNKKLKRMYYFEGCIARRDEDYISRDVSHAAVDTLFWGTYPTPGWLLLLRVVSHTVMDAHTYMSCMGPRLRQSGCVLLDKTCITILDIAFHWIAHLYHWWTWSWVLWILWVSFVEPVIDEYWACCWGYVIY